MRPGASQVQIMEASVSTLAETARQQTFNFCSQSARLTPNP